MKIALVQPVLSEDMENNLKKALDSMEKAASQGAQLACFPEIQLSPFFPQYPGLDMSRYAVTIDHEFVTRFREKCHALDLVGFPNIYLQERGKRYDASPVIDSDGSLLGISKMVHIVQAPCFFPWTYIPCDCTAPVACHVNHMPTARPPWCAPRTLGVPLGKSVA